MTLEEKGSKLVNAEKTGSSEQCAVILAVSMSSDKLTPFIIFKGVQGLRSCISQKFTDPAFGYAQTTVYTVQDKAWDDQHTKFQGLV